MSQNEYIYKNINIFKYMLITLMFIVGFLNSRQYLEFMGLGVVYNLLLMVFYALLLLMILYLFINFLYQKKRFNLYSFSYYEILLLAVLIKFLILFIQFPLLFLPGESLFSEFITVTGNLLLIAVIVKANMNKNSIKQVIWAFGLGLSFSTIIPLLFFPEMIGSRISHINGFTFNGSFWNASVIAYISIGWLLVYLASIESSRLKRNILLLLFIIFVLGSLAGLSRASLLSFLISLFVYLIASNQFRKYIRVTVFLVIIFFVIINFFPEAFGNFSQRLDGGIDIEEEGRIKIWKDYIEDIPSYFLIGELEGDYKRYSVTGHGPHSVFLNWFTQYGILGFIGFIVLLIGVLISIFKVNKNMPRKAAPLYAWLVAYLSVATINETGFMQLGIFGGIGLILAIGKNIDDRAYEN